jgi:hypothetical protein
VGNVYFCPLCHPGSKAEWAVLFKVHGDNDSVQPPSA